MSTAAAVALVVVAHLAGQSGGVVGSGSQSITTTYAVLPFKNLNADKELDFLRVGIAETTMADLRQMGRTVVERDQIDRALAELALQKTQLSDDSRAAQAGRIIGASHVLVGGYQRADEQIRITARVVVVETGVVDRSAKVTGKLDDVFDLQDKLVGEILNLPKPKPRPKSKAPKKQLEAYRAWVTAVSSSSDAEKIEGFRRALDLDPDFHYALSDLRALESRLNVYARKNRDIADDRVKAALAKLKDESLTLDERNLQAVQAMTHLMQQYRWAAIADVADEIVASKLQPGTHINAREHAYYFSFVALQTLKRTNLAVQAGERYLQTYPGGMFAQGIDLQLRAMSEQAHRHEEALRQSTLDLAELEKDEAEYEADMAARSKPLDPLRIRGFAFQRCSTMIRGERWTEALETCKAFVSTYKSSEDGDHLVKLARFFLCRGYMEIGHFDEAHDEALRLLDEHGTWARNFGLETMRSTWPRP